VGGKIVNVDGKTVERIKPPPKRHLHINPEFRSVILGGMERAAMEPGGTSYPVMGGFPFPVAGKTGTAERGAGTEDQSWYGVIAPYGNPRIVVAVTVEHGGFGVESAAPIARAILEQYFHLNAGGASGTAAASAGGVE